MHRHLKALNSLRQVVRVRTGMCPPDTIARCKGKATSGKLRLLLIGTVRHGNSTDVEHHLSQGMEDSHRHRTLSRGSFNDRKHVAEGTIAAGLGWGAPPADLRFGLLGAIRASWWEAAGEDGGLHNTGVAAKSLSVSHCWFLAGLGHRSGIRGVGCGSPQDAARLSSYRLWRRMRIGLLCGLQSR
jgi:hypothetical protein